jgi:hypothetical protein
MSNPFTQPGPQELAWRQPGSRLQASRSHVVRALPLLAASGLVALGACAHSVGQVVLDPEGGYSGVVVQVDESRISVQGRGGRLLDLALDDEGCVYGRLPISTPRAPGRPPRPPAAPQRVQFDQLRVCRAQTQPASGNAVSWHPIGAPLRSPRPEEADGLVYVMPDFQVAVSNDGKRMMVSAETGNGEVALPPGAAGDVLRQHPELLAVALVSGSLPEVPGGRWIARAP